MLACSSLRIRLGFAVSGFQGPPRHPHSSAARKVVIYAPSRPLARDEARLHIPSIPTRSGPSEGAGRGGGAGGFADLPPAARIAEWRAGGPDRRSPPRGCRRGPAAPVPPAVRSGRRGDGVWGMPMRHPRAKTGAPLPLQMKRRPPEGRLDASYSISGNDEYPEG